MYPKLIFILGIFLFYKHPKVPEEFYAKVIGIIDGDTIEVLYENKPIYIRLEHIDCPEKKQPYGTKSKQFVSNRIFAEKVKIKNKGKWHWDRLIAEVYYDDTINLNKELVRNGFAMHFKKYSKNKEYDQLEIKARNNKEGIWSISSTMAPWEYRKSKRHGNKVIINKLELVDNQTNNKKMKKIIPFILVSFTLTAFQEIKEKEVFICKTVKSKRYHLKKDCNGLKKCEGGIKKTTIKKAENVGRTLCKWEKNNEKK